MIYTNFSLWVCAVKPELSLTWISGKPIEVSQKTKVRSIFILFSLHENKERFQRSLRLRPELALSSHSQDRLDQLSYVTRLLDWVEYERD